MRTGAFRTVPRPYLGAALLAIAVVVAAWVVRDRFQPVVAGYPAPDFRVMDARGGTVTLSDFQNRAVLLNVWATWCGPCVEEMPSMQRLYEQFSRDEFEIAAISIDAPAGRRDDAGNPGGDPVAFAHELELTFPILLNPAGDIQRIYRTAGVPESFLIGPDGMIYKKVAGATTWDSESNVRLVERLVANASAASSGPRDR